MYLLSVGILDAKYKNLCVHVYCVYSKWGALFNMLLGQGIRFSLEKVDITLGRADITIERVDIFHLRED